MLQKILKLQDGVIIRIEGKFLHLKKIIFKLTVVEKEMEKIVNETFSYKFLIHFFYSIPLIVIRISCLHVTRLKLKF